MFKILNQKLIYLLPLFMLFLRGSAQNINSFISENPYFNQNYFIASGHGIKMTLSYDSVVINNKNYIRNEVLKTFDKKGRLISIDSSRCPFYDTLDKFAIRTKTLIEYKEKDTILLNIEDSSKTITRLKLVYYNGILMYSEKAGTLVIQNYKYDNYGNVIEILGFNPYKFKYDFDEHSSKITIYGGIHGTQWIFYYDNKTKLDLTTLKTGRFNKVHKYYYNSSLERYEITTSATYSYLNNGNSIRRIENESYNWGPENVFNPDTLSKEFDFEYSDNFLISINEMSCLKGSRQQKTFKYCQQYQTNYIYRRTGEKLIYMKSTRILLNEVYKDKIFTIKYSYFYD